MIIEDNKGCKFGGMCFEQWAPSKQFYGTGDTFVFTFGAGDEVKAFRSTGNNFMYQYFDKRCIMIGGDNTEGGRAALYLGDDFYRGSSSKTQCFKNEVLSSESEFLCVEMEVWGIE